MNVATITQVLSRWIVFVRRMRSILEWSPEVAVITVKCIN